MLHGFASSPHRLAQVRSAITQYIQDADFLVPQLPTGRLSAIRPQKIAKDLIEAIDQKVRDSNPKSVLFVGHSFGALLAREVYLAANAVGPSDGSKIYPDQPLTWASQVKRIVLLAAMSRGWRVSHSTGRWRAILYSAGAFIGSIIEFVTGKKLLIMTARRGGTFVTDLRVRWSRFQQQSSRSGTSLPMVVQLLGTVDDVVSPDDNVDLFAGADFHYLEVPHTGHRTILDLCDLRDGPARRELLKTALVDPREDVAVRSLRLGGDPLPETRTVTDVLFVLHGIRDYGFWTSRLARRVEQHGRLARRAFATEAGTYGYFGMGPFLLPGERRQKVEWFMDRYADFVSQHPDARLHFIGHSHGTYVAASALRDYQCCAFDSVVFTGSVVPRGYKWKERIDNKQCARVLNYVATRDWVVAWFPSLFEFLRRIPLVQYLVMRQDLGGAGHFGFDKPNTDLPVHNVRWVTGGHGAALAEVHWDRMARFIIDGQVPEPDPEATRQNHLIRTIAHFPPLVWAFAAGTVGYGAWWIGGSLEVEAIPAALIGAAMVLYVGLLRFILVRF
jgi:pimeloyl-ACP methyl ester carboxylesterase